MAKFNKGGLVGGFDTIRFDTPSFSGVWSLEAQGQAVKADTWESPPFGYAGASTVAFFAGGLFQNTGDAADNRNVIEFVNIASTGNGSDYGDLTTGRSQFMNGTVASTTRGLFAGGSRPSATHLNTIDFITMASKANAADFGDLTTTKKHGSAFSSSTRGVYANGQVSNGGAAINVIEYVTIANTGNGTDFGDTSAGGTLGAGLASTTRGVFRLGSSFTDDTIEYVTIANTGNSTDFGNLSVGRALLASAESATKGVFAGGYGSAVSNVIDIITIASTGNASDFGDLTVTRYQFAGTSSTVRGVFAGGEFSGGISDTIDYITIASAGNATDFGNLTEGKMEIAACSSATASGAG